ncbi:MAG: YjbE family putative metal transport protein [Alphaproteobacteria bacterium]|nr:YjbE family putative metal transport protein [Alphaproteobacteria bacterium]
MFDFISAAEFSALGQVILIDLILAGDNAIAVGMAAAGLPAKQRGKVILIGILAATVLRIVFALGTTFLLDVFGLLIAGGILLLWVSWKLWQELRAGGHAAAEQGEQALEGRIPTGAKPKTFAQAALQIVVADISMSLDNVLAVAGAAHEHPWVLVIGLVLSVALMGTAAVLVARILQRYRWIAYFGILLIFYISLQMMWTGANQSLTEMIADWAAFRPWIIAIHITAATIWIGGMICLPLLYAAHVRGNGRSDSLASAESRLLRIVIAPAMILAMLFGAVLLVIPGEPDLASTWLWIKLAAVAALLALHGAYLVAQRQLTTASGGRTAFAYDGSSVVAATLGGIIVFMVVVQPF